MCIKEVCQGAFCEKCLEMGVCFFGIFESCPEVDEPCSAPAGMSARRVRVDIPKDFLLLLLTPVYRVA